MSDSVLENSSSVNRLVAPDTLPVSKVAIQQAVTSKLTNGITVHSIDAGFQDLVRVEFLFENKVFNPDSPALVSAVNRLVTEGTSRHTALQIAEMVDDYGAFLETEESADTCSVVLYTLNKHLDKTLPVVREVLTEAAFPDSEVELYRRNQIQRLVVENEKVNSIARRKFNQLLFGEHHPYGHLVTRRDYEALTHDDLLQYHRANYSADRCVIFVAGRVTDETLRVLEKEFGSEKWGASNAVQKQFGSIQSTEAKLHFQEKEGALQSAIRIGRSMITRSHPDYPGMAVLNTLLGGYFGSRLMSNIREDKGYTYGIGSAMVSLREAGYFFISTEVGADVTNSALEEIYKEVHRLQQEPADIAELTTVRNYLSGTFLKSIDGPFALIDRFKTLKLSGLGYDYYDKYLETVRNIQPQQLQELAIRYFQKNNLLELVVGLKK
ncbi:MAG: M16 family metallopeptidase [Bacteroidota bacterium]